MFSISSGESFSFFLERDRYFFKIVPLGPLSLELSSSDEDAGDDDESESLWICRRLCCFDAGMKRKNKSFGPC
jgi:hypothetical protein